MINKLHSFIFSDKIRKETFWAFVARGFSVVAGLFFLFFIPKHFGIENYGRFSLILAYISIFEILFGNSINPVIKKELSKYKFNEQGASSFIGGLKVKLLLFLFGGIVSTLVIFTLKITILQMYFWPFIILLFLMNFWGLVVNCFEAAHRLFYTSVMYFLEYSVTILFLLIAYAYQYYSFKYLLLSFIIGYIFSFGYGLATILRKFRVNFKVYFFDFKKSEGFKKLIILTFNMSLASASYVLLTRIDSIMLSQMATLKDVGYYNIATEIARNAAVVGTIIILGSVPLFVSTCQAELFKKTITKLIFANMAILIGFILFSNIFVKVVYGTGYEKVPGLLMILGLYPLCISLQSFTSEILILKEKGAFLFKSGLVAVAFNVILNFFLIKWLGVYGAAVATLLAYTLWFMMNFASVRKLI